MESWYKHSIKKEYEKNPRLEEDMISEVRLFIEKQPHLPQLISDVELVHHIQSCDFDVEHAKKALEINYTIRSKAVFFKIRDPSSDEVVKSSQCFQLSLLHGVDDKGQHAILGKLNNYDSSKYSFNNTIRNTIMLMDLLRLEHGTLPGFVAVMDLTGFTLSHLIKIPFGSLRYFMHYLQEGSPTKLSALHLVNTKGSIIDKVMMLLRPLLSERITQVMHLHQGYETLYDHGFNQEKLPLEYGGTAGAYKEISDNSHDRLINYAEFFREEESYRVDESKRSRTKYFGLF